MEAEIVIPGWARQIVSDHTDMERDPHPVDAGKVSAFRLTLPDDVYFEYAFLDEDGRMRADPQNPLRGDNPWYPEVSALVGPRYQPGPLARLAGEEGPEPGTLDRHRIESDLLSGVRRVNVYTPGGSRDASLPLILVFDGTAFLRVAALHRVLEALLADGAVRPARLAFVEPVDRNAEYGFGEGYRDFLTDALLPFLERSYPHGDDLIVMGASLGGLLGATLALLEPLRFGTVVTFSGAFLGHPDDRDFYRSERSWVLDRLDEDRPLPRRWYAQVGTIEWLTGVNRRLARHLEARGVEHRYLERNAGHNWVNWRDGLAEALTFALGEKAP